MKARSGGRSRRPSRLRPFSVTYDRHTGEMDRKGRPRTEPVYVVVNTPEEALRELERQLNDRTDSISLALREWLGDAIQKRRTEPRRFPTLEHALGLVRGRGSPGTPIAHKALARQIFSLRLKKASWLRIQSTLNTSLDVRTLQRIYAKYWTKLATEEIGRRLDAQPRK